jgi:lipopolysaccharide export system protein LptC
MGHGGKATLTVVSHVDRRGPAALQNVGRTDSNRRFRAAIRHSRFVRFLRVLIPTSVVLGTVAVILVATVLDPLRALAKLPVNLDGLTVSGTKITMHQPRIGGLTQEKRPYVLTARAAAQDVTNPNVIELYDLRGKSEMKETGTVDITAKLGLFESKSDKLTLRKDIVVTTPQYEVLLEEAVMNVRTNHVVSEKPVQVTMPQGTVNANRLEILNSGEIVRFERDVVMVITSDQPHATATAEAK